MPDFSNAFREYQRGVAQGRGQGRFSQYKPWLAVRTVKSYAVRSRIFSRKFGRTLHFMSDAEVQTFLQLEWNDNVIEIREQFPLHPKVTNQIADELHVLPAGYSRGGIVMTTDFLVTYKTADGSSSLRAYSVKATLKDVENARTNTKLLIEQRYWRRRSVPCTVVVSENFNGVFCANLRTFFPERNTEYSQTDLEHLSDHICRIRAYSPDCQVSALRSAIPPMPDCRVRVSAIAALKILLAHKVWKFSGINTKPFLETRICDFEVGHVC